MNEVRLINHLRECVLTHSLTIAPCVNWLSECTLMFAPSTHRMRIKTAVSMWEMATASNWKACHLHIWLWVAAMCWVCSVLYVELHPLHSSSKATHPPTETFLLSMCDYITPASSPPLSEPSELVPGVSVGVESRLFTLSMGCYWWGEVMDLPAVLTGTLRINQTVGKTQPAIPHLSRLNCHFISFIYGGSALFWTPALSVLSLKTQLFFFFLPYIVLWQPIYTPVLFSSLFPGKPSILPPTHFPRNYPLPV